MKNKGFTLIELLAVIVILAIIALIAVPIVLNIIENSKKESVKVSAEHYFDAVEQAIAREYLKDSTVNLDGKYEIVDEGKKIKLGTREINVEYDGEGLKEGAIGISNGKVASLEGVKIDKWYVRLKAGEVVLLEKLLKSTLMSGHSFNINVKTLANQSDVGTWDEDQVVTSIEFLSNGELPEGYTLDRLKQLSSIDVSKDKDKSIMAYFDSETGKVYIYSDNLIVFNEESSYMFSRFNVLDNISFGEIDTSKATYMNSMFYGYSGSKAIDLSKLDTSNVTEMGQIFYGYSSSQPLDLSSFDTSNVTNMNEMFSRYNSPEPLDVGGLDTSKVTNMYGMFYEYKSSDSLDLSNFDTSNVENMGAMFYGSSLISIDFSSFDTSKVTNMSWMFASCNDLTSLDLTKFDTNNTTNMSSMFFWTSNLTSVLVSSDKWNTTNADTTDMFTNSGITEVTYVES